METPLFDESRIRITGIHASGLCGVGAIAGADLGRYGLSPCVQTFRSQAKQRQRTKPNIPTIGPNVGSGGRESVVLVRGVMGGEVGGT